MKAGSALVHFLKLCIATGTAVVFLTRTAVQISPKDLYVAQLSIPQHVCSVPRNPFGGIPETEVTHFCLIVSQRFFH